MATQHLTMRLDEGTFRRLEAHRKRAGTSRSDLGRTLLEEGLRMEDHPGIVFRSGPGGRRPGLGGGPDVWEVARLLRGVDAEGDAALGHVAAQMDLGPEQVRVALRYYAEFRSEVDEWIQRVDEDAERAEAAWRREQALLQR